jgi:hypothetical protein
MLNGRYGPDKDEAVKAIYHEWNTWLGFYCFGSEGGRIGEPYPCDWTDGQLTAIYGQVRDADFVEIAYDGGPLIEALHVEFRPLPEETDGSVELHADDTVTPGMLSPVCRCDGDDLRRMRIEGNTLFIMAKEDPAEIGHSRAGGDNFELRLSLFSRIPKPISRPT